MESQVNFSTLCGQLKATLLVGAEGWLKTSGVFLRVLILQDIASFSHRTNEAPKTDRVPWYMFDACGFPRFGGGACSSCTEKYGCDCFSAALRERGAEKHKILKNLPEKIKPTHYCFWKEAKMWKRNNPELFKALVSEALFVSFRHLAFKPRLPNYH